jgi:hypothetical protein
VRQSDGKQSGSAETGAERGQPHSARLNLRLMGFLPRWSRFVSVEGIDDSLTVSFK